MVSSAGATRTHPSPRPVLTGHEVSIERDPASAPGQLSEAEASRPGQCRRIVRAALHYWRLASIADTAELLTSELVTNALRHGAGHDIGMRVFLSEAHLVIEVRDGSANRPVLRQATPEDEDGRGLVLVDAMADKWGTSADGTMTWCSLALPQFPLISLPGDPSAPDRARRIVRSALTDIGCRGTVYAAEEVVAQLVENAVAHGVLPDFVGQGVTVLLRLDERHRLVIDVSDPNPKFPDFAAALAGENGHGLSNVQRHGAEVTCFTQPSFDGKTVRAIMTLASTPILGQVDP
ncbi:ATP-binding protein [Streptomyces sp. NPDC101455]|uniref:ATP-binding protein n=1 Tax=Streptomyces sp. NPDC101455 TaxID=3366142 RepID=UPI003817572C